MRQRSFQGLAIILASFLLLATSYCVDSERLTRVEEPDASLVLDADAPDAELDAAVLDAAPELLDASTPDVPWTPPVHQRGPYDLRITLRWDYGVLGHLTDVDLHLLHPDGPEWGEAPLDCYYANLMPRWDGTATTSPTLDHDVIFGYGPETITLLKGIDRPAPYRVGVHYFSDHNQGPSTVYVTIECRDIVIEMGPQVLESHQIWRLADVTFWKDSCFYTPVDRITSAGDHDYRDR